MKSKWILIVLSLIALSVGVPDTVDNDGRIVYTAGAQCDSGGNGKKSHKNYSTLDEPSSGPLMPEPSANILFGLGVLILACYFNSSKRGK